MSVQTICSISFHIMAKSTNLINDSSLMTPGPIRFWVSSVTREWIRKVAIRKSIRLEICVFYQSIHESQERFVD